MQYNLYINLILLFVISFFTVPQVSTDGEPHEILTMIAVSSGCIVAIIVLVILIIVIDCKMKRFVLEKKNLIIIVII